MTLFDSIGIAGSGVTVYRKWLDAVSDNIANMNDAAPTSGPAFQERFVIAQEAADGKGAQVGGARFGNAAGRMVYEPNHPYADDKGYVRYPDINLSDQMGSLIMAQRGYQANLAVVDRAKGAYEAALQLGRS
ncbi:flagellar basal-body rod protein FlgC [Pilimelia terevasa]|uniref:Flagellar basal-body rod protein FlgC n=1 Tax=Pilimelia terevasa TaxID=53372 RepID=A0A8J3BFH6_9ACTN|nr:flagellar basal body rod C-terminal domain-containing protein [Pilimelia terevasa]GGK18230.1 flagellar basal-body rod protein FlgC [Pilimelia terevasa]